MQAPVSVLILTYNEQENIAACLESVRWAAEVLVVDSLSTDRTAEIARSLNAQVYTHPFEGYSKQRNWALDNLPFAHDWILVLDADELAPPALAREIAGVAAQPVPGCVGFYVDRQLFFLGRQLRHGGLSPSWILRLFKRGHGRLESHPMNEHLLLDGKAEYLKEPLYHKDNRPVSEWIAKHNRYSDIQADEYLIETTACFPGSMPPRLFGPQEQRKRWIRLRVWNRLPLLSRGFLLFFRNYFLKAGFLDGKAGFVYHILWSFWFPFLIDVKILEAKSRHERG